MLQLNDLLPPSKQERYWTINGSEHEGLSDSVEYVLYEYYCDNPGCNCTQIMIDVMQIGSDARPIDKSLAVIEYDWSQKESAGKPKLSSESPRTKLALHLLKAYKSLVHNAEYLARIKNDFSRVKSLALSKSAENKGEKIKENVKIGRNDQCFCGSGKKYKKCCILK